MRKNWTFTMKKRQASQAGLALPKGGNAILKPYVMFFSWLNKFRFEHFHCVPLCSGLHVGAFLHFLGSLYWSCHYNGIGYIGYNIQSNYNA